jgi:TonB family protein
MMVANTLQAALPWMGSQAEDRRFRRILVQVLVICFVVGGIIPAVQVPLLEPETAVDLPPRLVRIIENGMVPFVPPPTASQSATQRPAAPLPEPRQPVVKKPVTVPRPESQEIPDTKSQPVQAKPLATPRQKAAQTGLLAMSDALNELRSIAPKTTTARSAAAVSGLPTERQKPSMLAADITRGSAGIEGGVAHQSVLGASGLPGKGGSSGQSILRGAGTPPVSGGTPARQSGMVRSEEEIQEILDRNKSAMYTIYNRELRQHATLQGKLVMNITIAPSGRVTRCTIIDSELNAASLEEQLIRLIKRIDFGNKPGVPVVTTRVPIEFFPR